MTADPIDVFRVATFNVLSPGLGTLAPWEDRRHNVAATIRGSGASIVALQEAGWDRVQDGILLAEDVARLSRMSLSDAGFSGDAILYDADVWTPGRAGHFLLPRGRRDRRRSAIWQRFRLVEGDRELLVVSTHLSHGPERDRARVRQARRLVRRTRAANSDDLPTIVLGDFNSWEGRAIRTPLDLLSSAGFAEAVPRGPSVGSLTLSRRHHRLDHIVVSTGLRVVDAAVMIPELPGPASDHRLVWADLAWGEAHRASSSSSSSAPS